MTKATTSRLPHCADILRLKKTATMYRIWQIPELLVHIVSFLPASDINRCFHLSHHFADLLKANLPPQLRSLPDPRSKCVSRTRTPPETVSARASAYLAHELATPKQLKMEDSYYYWREDARSQVLDALLPSLHPLFAKFDTRLVDGYEALVEGKTNISLQTNVPFHDLCELVNGNKMEGWDEQLGLGVKGVTIFCLGGVQWDLLYSGVRYRELGGVQRFSVKIEREEGVGLGDIMEELAGTLVGHGASGVLGQDVTLVWVFGDGCD